MAAKNEITGDAIQSRVLSAQGRSNWDRIFTKKPAYVWLEETCGRGSHIIADDGWNTGDGVTTSTPITLADFNERIKVSTISVNSFHVASSENATNLQREVLEKYGLNCGRIVAHDRATYEALNPIDRIYFSANIFTEIEGKVWYGDLNITSDNDALTSSAIELGQALYVLDEKSARKITDILDLAALNQLAAVIYTP